MATIQCEGKEFQLEDGSPIADTCRELDFPFGCENGICGTCEIEVIGGEENLNELNDLELDRGLNRTRRLACQAKIKEGKVRLEPY